MLFRSGTPPMNVLECEYENGALYLGGGLKITLDAQTVRAHDEFMSGKLREIREILSTAETADAAALRNYLLPLGAYKSELNKKNAAPEKPKKQNIIDKFKKKFGFLKKKEPESAEGYIAQLKEMEEQYRAALTGRHPMKVGVRPENLTVTQTDGENVASVDTEIVEILGSEFIAYANGEAGRLVIKSQTPVEAHKTLKVRIDASKIHLFDAVSEQNVAFKK